jgi:Skp family chaperone for outer membrane proteins
MKKSLLALMGVAGVLGVLAVTQLVAQQPAAAPPSRTGTALVDLGVVMKHSNRFNQAMDRLKTDYEAKAQELKKKGEYGNQLTEQLKQLPPNTPEYKQLEERLLKMRADYEIDGKRFTDDTRDAESKIVLGLVREVQAELERYGKATGTMLILRSNPEPPDLTDPRIILQEIHKPIVYDSGLDATSAVLNSLNRGTTPPPTAGRPAQQGGYQR